MPGATPFEAEALARLPLAEAVLEAAAHVLCPEFTAGFAARHGTDAAPGLIGFGDLVALVGDALLRHGGSLNAAYDEADDPPASRQAFYGKLRRVPPATSEALLREGAERLAPLVPAEPEGPLPASLAGLDVLVIDGKKLKRVAKRLKPCRGAPGKLLGGKLLVAWRPRTGLAVAMAAEADGHANECRLVPALLAQLPAGAGGGPPRLWVADRQFGDLAQPRRVLAAGGHFLFRLNGKTGFCPDPARPPRAGVDAGGRPFAESWGRLGKGGGGPEARLVRLELPGGGGAALEVVTDLTDAGAYPAADLLELYRRRWGLERVFQRVTETFGLARFIGCSPEATVFQAAYCLLVYGLIQLVKAYAAEAGGVTAEGVSTENLFKDAREELAGAYKLLGAGRLAELVPAEPDPGRLAARLRGLLAGAWRPRWRKAAEKRPRPPRPPRTKRSGAVESVYRLQGRHKKDQAQ